MHLSEGNDKLTVYEMFSRSFFLLVFKKINKTNKIGFMRLVAVFHMVTNVDDTG